MTTAYPLSWPQGIDRLPEGRRETGTFKTSLLGALDNVKTSLRLFAQASDIPVSRILLSSNVSLGIDKPADPGVAVWFLWDGEQCCIAVDRYRSPAANLQAIHHVVEARRTELRHGTLAMVRATFRGLRALPAPDQAPWHEVLGVSPDAPLPDIEAAWRQLADRRHPDKGGSTEAMAELNRARDEARRARGSARKARDGA